MSFNQCPPINFNTPSAFSDPANTPAPALLDHDPANPARGHRASGVAGRHASPCLAAVAGPDARPVEAVADDNEAQASNTEGQALRNSRWCSHRGMHKGGTHRSGSVRYRRPSVHSPWWHKARRLQAAFPGKRSTRVCDTWAASGTAVGEICTRSDRGNRCRCGRGNTQK